jgi:hypothetical protein
VLGEKDRCAGKLAGKKSRLSAKDHWLQRIAGKQNILEAKDQWAGESLKAKRSLNTNIR